MWPPQQGIALSDAIYGPTERYVSRHRLKAMLDYEYDLLLERLDAKRGGTTEFFVFADTVATRRQGGDGWLGIKFQDQPGADPSEIYIHLRMLDVAAGGSRVGIHIQVTTAAAQGPVTPLR